MNTKILPVILLFVAILIGGSVVGWSTVEAAVPCGSHSKASDPACYTTAASTVSESCTWQPYGGEGLWYIQCCWPGGGCRNVYDGAWNRGGKGYYCDNNHYGTGKDFNPNAKAQSRNVNSKVCYYANTVKTWSACVNGTQVPTSVGWTSTRGTSCRHTYPRSRACCNTPPNSFTIDGKTGTVTVIKGENFTLKWAFTNPGTQYSCTLKRPAVTSYTPGLSTVALKGSQNDIITEDKNPVLGTNYPYVFACKGPKICDSTYKVINVRVGAQAFGLSASAQPNPSPVGSVVRWTATPRGGKPPYTYSWSGDVSGTAQFIEKMYSVVGTKSATVQVTDSAGGVSVANASVEITDDRTPQ